MNNIDEELIKLNERAYKKNEVPVSAVIVKDNKIISKANNRKNRSKNVINHAEILAIKKASKKLHTWILEDCDLYVTLEPCPMCTEIIKQSRIKNVYYYIKRDKIINYKTNFSLLKNDNSIVFKNDLKKFFENRR